VDQGDGPRPIRRSILEQLGGIYRFAGIEECRSQHRIEAQSEIMAVRTQRVTAERS